MASAMKVTKVEVWAGDLRDQAGELARVLEAIAGGGGDVKCVIARRRETGGGVVFLSPVTGKRAQDAARSAGLSQATMGTLRVEGPDRRGLGSRITRAIGAAGINMRGLTAAVQGGSYVCYIGFDSPGDADRAAQALKGMKPAATKAKSKKASKRRAARKPARRSR